MSRLLGVTGRRDRPRAAIWVAIAAVCLLPGAHHAVALHPTLEVNQYAHTAWRIRDGFFRGLIRAITQAPDGYLWLASEFGVLRFDGIRAVPWEPSGEQQLPSRDIWSVLAGRDGSLWIGTAKGLARWKGGTLIDYPELSGHLSSHSLKIAAARCGLPPGSSYRALVRDSRPRSHVLRQGR